MSWVQGTDEKSSYLFLRLTPNARYDAVCGVYGNVDGKTYLQMSVRAVPENGQANKAVIAFLAKILSVSKSDLKLKSGSKSRFKCIDINLPVKLVEQELKHLSA